jgi:hypothetical protein
VLPRIHQTKAAIAVVGFVLGLAVRGQCAMAAVAGFFAFNTVTRGARSFRKARCISVEERELDAVLQLFELEIIFYEERGASVQPGSASFCACTARRSFGQNRALLSGLPVRVEKLQHSSHE